MFMFAFYFENGLGTLPFFTFYVFGYILELIFKNAWITKYLTYEICVDFFTS